MAVKRSLRRALWVTAVFGKAPPKIALFCTVTVPLVGVSVSRRAGGLHLEKLETLRTVPSG